MLPVSESCSASRPGDKIEADFESGEIFPLVGFRHFLNLCVTKNLNKIISKTFCKIKLTRLNSCSYFFVSQEAPRVGDKTKGDFEAG